MPTVYNVHVLYVFGCYVCNVCIVFRINGNVGNMGSDVGYCPQVNALDDYMTGRSLLTFYCYVKGLQDAHAVRQHFF